MSYTPNNGQGSMLANTKKTKDTQPDWRGDFMTPNGERLSIAAWNRKTKTGLDSLSLKVEAYQERQPQTDTPTRAATPKPATPAFDDEIPF